MRLFYTILAVLTITCHGRSKEDQFHPIFRLAVKLELKKFDYTDYKSLEKIYKKNSDDRSRILIQSLIARYHTYSRNQPIDALFFLAPIVLEKNTAKKWIKDYQLKQKQRIKLWEDAVKTAKKQKKVIPIFPRSLALLFPTSSQWLPLNRKNAPLAIEVARALKDLNATNTAISIIDKVGQSLEDNTLRSLSLELAGDIMLTNKLYEKSLSFYKSSLKFLTNDSEEYELDSWNKLIKKRIQIKISKVTELIEAGKYGPDWVAYRNAERQRDQESFHLAYLQYQSIIDEYPDSVYSEASVCYQIKCLLKLTKKKQLPQVS